MPPPDPIHVGDVGTEIVVRFLDERGRPIDVSAAGVLKIKVKPPDPAATANTTAALLTTGLDGRAKVTSTNTTFPTAGQYSVQGYAEVGAAKFHTKVGLFDVEANL